MEILPYARQEITDGDVSAVARALKAPMLTQGPLVAEFEAALAATVGAKFAVAVSSGTAALHAAYFAAGVRPEVDVLTSPITFVATANASYYLGGGIRLADVDPNSALLDPREIPAASQTERVKVIAPVHFGGQVADMEAIAQIALDRGWTIVEDAAHALGARYTVNDTEYSVGACAHSAMCCFSFHPVKHITTGEGGAVTTNDASLRDRLTEFRTHGITRDAGRMEAFDGPWYYEQHNLGFNYRLTDVQSALGLSQLDRLSRFVQRRRAIAALYDTLFDNDEYVQPMKVPVGSRGSYHLYIVLVPAAARRRAFERLRATGIGVNVHYIPLYKHPFQRDRLHDQPLQNAETYYARAITLPMFPALGDAEVKRIAASVLSSVHGCMKD